MGTRRSARRDHAGGETSGGLGGAREPQQNDGSTQKNAAEDALDVPMSEPIPGGETYDNTGEEAVATALELHNPLRNGGSGNRNGETAAAPVSNRGEPLATVGGLMNRRDMEESKEAHRFPSNPLPFPKGL